MWAVDLALKGSNSRDPSELFLLEQVPSRMITLNDCTKMHLMVMVLFILRHQALVIAYVMLILMRGVLLEIIWISGNVLFAFYTCCLLPIIKSASGALIQFSKIKTSEY